MHRNSHRCCSPPPPQSPAPLKTRHPTPLVCLGFALLCSSLPAEDLTTFHITAPQPWQVLQRSTTPPDTATNNSPPLGSAIVQIRLTTDKTAKPSPNREITAAYRILPASANTPVHDAATNTRSDLPWQTLKLQPDTNQHSQPDQPANSLHSSITVAAGGWYRLEVRLQQQGQAPQTTAVEPFGIGEVFLVAGQSYATNTNDEILHVTDPQLRVAAYDWETGKWQLANDPQPAPDRSNGGSIWPPVGDLLTRHLNLPVGFVNVAVGGTSTRQWMPAETLSQRLQQIGKQTAPFRAVLWQQGESDVIEQTAAADYVSRLQQIRSAACDAWQFSPPWFCALSTHHPTVYNRPAEEHSIREAISTVSRLPGFQLGPDTDSLRGENRGGPKSRRHFSPLGQRNAAKLWADTLLKYLNAEHSQHSTANPAVPQTESTPQPKPPQQ